MNLKQQRKKIHKLLLEADRLMGEALRINNGKNLLFGDKIVESQFALDDAIAYLFNAEKKKSEKSLKKVLTSGRKAV